jgi:hypothetical protein
MARTQKDKQAIADWKELAESILSATPVDRSETLKEQRDRIAKLEADPEAWFKYYFPKYATAEPAPFHKAATKRVIENSEYYEVRIWSRELAKSTRTMMEVLYLGLVKNKRYVLMISNSLDNAIRLLMPYQINLEVNPRIIRDYGKQVKLGSWDAAEFTTKKGLAFRALGAGQSPRGTRNEERRPDVILFDDIDTDVDCRNPEIIQSKWEWIEEAAIGTRSISEPTLIIFCGNRIAKDCCIERAREYADHKSEINIRDEKGKSSWPQKNTEAHIDRVLGQKSYFAQQKEYFNNPINEGSVFKEMAYKPARPIKEYSLLVCYTDPSFKESKKNDFKATVLVGKWRDEFHVIKAFVEQTTTAKMIEWHYEIMRIVGGQACYYQMEANFLQDIILKEFYEAARRNGKTIPIIGDQRQKPDKFTRIESLLEPLNRNGKLFLNEDEKSDTHMKCLYDQFKAIAPGSRSHDDGPDAVEGAVWIINNKETAVRPDSVYAVRRPLNKKRF